MRAIVGLFLGMFFGAVGTAGVFVLLLPVTEPVRTPVASGVRDPRIDDLLARFGRIEAKLDAVSAPRRELTALERAAAAQMRATASGDAAAPASTVEADSLAREILARLDRIEARLDAGAAGSPESAAAESDRRFKAMSKEQLMSRAKLLAADPKNAADAVDAWNALLKRELTPEEKGQVLDKLGNAYFSGGDYAGAVTAFRGALEITGSDTDQGHGTSHSLAWSLARSGDPRGGVEELDRLLQKKNLSDPVHASARSAIAVFSEQLGDKARARQELQAIVDTFGTREDDWSKRMVEGAKARLAKLN